MRDDTIQQLTRPDPDLVGPTFLGLFSGCGGLDLGFSQAHFRCVGAYDIDPLALSVHRRNIGAPTHVCDLSASLPDRGLREVDVVVAGPPCQGFSLAGKRHVDDPRNSLLLAAATIAIRLHPKAIVIENVRGAIAGDHRKHWIGLLRLLNANGYATSELLCDATQFGLAQIRRRIVVIAWNTGRHTDFLPPLQPPKVLSDVIRGVERLPNHDPRLLDASSPLYQIALRIAPGNKLSNVRGGPHAVHTWQIPQVFGRTSERTVLEAILKLRRRLRSRETGDADPVPARAISQSLKCPVSAVLESLLRKGHIRRVGRCYDLVHTFNGKFRRLAWDRPSFTVDTRFGDPRMFLHPSENRGLSVREAARIQGFPDTFVFDGPTRAQFKMIGNAVPPPIGSGLAVMVRNLLLDD